MRLSARLGLVVLPLALAAAAFLGVGAAAQAIQYEYDALHRLVRVVYDDGTSLAYTYDRAGNRLSKTVIEDHDGDGISYAGGVHFCASGNTQACEDNCPTIANSDQADQDADAVGDACDNCVATTNPRVVRTPASLTGNQLDVDGDGYGNNCDADFDNNGTVGLSDFNRLRSQFGRNSSHPAFDPRVDSDGNGAIGLSDFNALRRSFGRPPGPTCSGCPVGNLP